MQSHSQLRKSMVVTVLCFSALVRRPVEDTILQNLPLECLRKAVDGLAAQSRDLIELRYVQ